MSSKVVYGVGWVEIVVSFEFFAWSFCCTYVIVIMQCYLRVFSRLSWELFEFQGDSFFFDVFFPTVLGF